MRVINNSKPTDLKRKTGTKDPRAKYYIIAEGDKTEVQYFKGLIDNRNFLNIQPLVQIFLVGNEESEKGHSHPLKKLENFENSIKDERILFSNKFDKACFIYDRDPGNFFDNQYDEMIKKCDAKGYYTYVSNPTFEFFLLLHNDKVLTLNREKMKDNNYVTKKKRYLEEELSKIFGCNKTNIDFNKFKPNIKKAIENEKKFCEDLNGLKNNLGSNVGKLVDELLG